jgi:site-specific DNA recombinase
VRADPLERAVWSAVSDALRRPEVLVEEYQQRVARASSQDNLKAEARLVETALKRTQSQEDRITDAYVGGAMDLGRYKSEMDKLRARRSHLQSEASDIGRRVRQEADTRDAVRHLELFCHRVSEGLDTLTFEERQSLLRLVVDRVTLVENGVRVDTVIPTDGEHVQLSTRRREPVEPLLGRA